MRRRKEPLILRLLYLAVFGKEDLLHTVQRRDGLERSTITLTTRSKA